MDLAIIIVSWNVKDKLRENLESLFESEGDTQFKVFVVDNNSHDGSADMTEREFPQVQVIRNRANLGFGKANNQVLKELDCKFALLLNPDMRVRPDTLMNMLKWMRENKQASVAGCHLVDEAGETIKHVRSFPTLRDQLMIVLKMPHLFPGVLRGYIRADFDYHEASQVDSIRGGFFFINLWAVKSLRHFLDSTLPQLDERYFLWFEEVDYCKQIKKAGGQVWYSPVAKCTDLVGQSFMQVKRSQTQRYMRDSMLKYFKKWRTGKEVMALKLIWPIGMFLAIFGEKINIKPKAKT